MLVKCYVRVSDASKRATTYSYSAVMYELAGNRGVAVIECTLFFAVLGARMSGVLVLSWGNLARSAYLCRLVHPGLTQFRAQSNPAVRAHVLQ